MKNELKRSDIRIFGALTALGNDLGGIHTQLAPLFYPILVNLKNKGESTTTAVEIADEFSNSYKKNCTSDVVRYFVRHFEQSKWIAFKPQNFHEYSLTVSSVIDPENSVLEDFNRLAAEFKEFSLQYSEKFEVKFVLVDDVDFYKRLLIDWLLISESFNEKRLKLQEVTENDTVNILSTDSGKNEDYWCDPLYQVLCAKFIKRVCESNQSNIQILIKLATLALLTEVIQDFVKSTEHVESTDLKIFMDTRVVMEYLNVSGRNAHNNICLIIEQLTNIGAKLCIYDQTVSEVKNALSSFLKSGYPYGPTARAITSGETNRDLVRYTAENLTELLIEKGVSIIYEQEFTEPEFCNIVNDELKEELSRNLYFINEENRRKHDVAVSLQTMAQIQNQQSNDLFKLNAILLTRNTLLAKLTNIFLKRKRLLNNICLGPVIHQNALATFLWLRTGKIGEISRVSKNLLLSTCEQILETRPKFIERVNEVIESIDDKNFKEQYKNIIKVDGTIQILMDLTLDSEELITKRNIDIYMKKVDAIREKEVKEQKNLETKIKESIKIENDIIERLGKRVSEKILKFKFYAYLSIPVMFITFALIALFSYIYLPTWMYFIDFVSAIVLAIFEIILIIKLRSNSKMDVVKMKLLEFAETEGTKPILDKYDFEWNGSSFDFKRKIESNKS